MGQKKDLKTSFDIANQAVQVTRLSQQPWLDDNGDHLSNEQDGLLACSRGLSGSYAGNAPVIDIGQVTVDEQGVAKSSAQVRDDFGLEEVWVQVFEPGFVEPPPTIDPDSPVLDTPVVSLEDKGNNHYQQSYKLDKLGRYTFVFYAKDLDNNSAKPYSVSYRTGIAIFLPSVRK